MKILWNKRAVTQLHQIEDYILSNFGERVRREFMDEVEQAVLLLADMPAKGKLDPLFAHRKQEYRSIVVRRLNKIVYYVRTILYILQRYGTPGVSRSSRLTE